MPKVIRIKEWKKKRDPKKGLKLQRLANQMLMRGETGEEYKKLRKAAEYHLGFWDFEKKPFSYGATPTRNFRTQTDAYFPTACVQARCGFLPAGSAACMHENHECP